MELTLITFPTIVLTVSLVAYYAAYLLKGNDLLVNKVADIVDIDQQTGFERAAIACVSPSLVPRIGIYTISGRSRFR